MKSPTPLALTSVSIVTPPDAVTLPFKVTLVRLLIVIAEPLELVVVIVSRVIASALAPVAVMVIVPLPALMEEPDVMKTVSPAAGLESPFKLSLFAVSDTAPEPVPVMLPAAEKKIDSAALIVVAPAEVKAP